MEKTQHKREHITLFKYVYTPKYLSTTLLRNLPLVTLHNGETRPSPEQYNLKLKQKEKER